MCRLRDARGGTRVFCGLRRTRRKQNKIWGGEPETYVGVSKALGIDALIGGPIGRRLIEKRNLLNAVVPEDDSLLVEDEKRQIERNDSRGGMYEGQRQKIQHDI